MNCPECRSEDVVNENTNKPLSFVKFGGDLHNVCRRCGCRFVTFGLTGCRIAEHGKKIAGEGNLDVALAIKVAKKRNNCYWHLEQGCKAGKCKCVGFFTRKGFAEFVQTGSGRSDVSESRKQKLFR